jgi:hypothetical protein
MAYQVDRFNGIKLVSVEDGTIDTTTDLRFLGKNYAGYGEVQNENFLHLLENFANTSAPPKAITGQIWYDSSNKKIKFYDGTKFRTAGGSEYGPTAPSGLSIGDFWLDTTTDQLYVWNGTSYVLIGPDIAPDLGASAIQVVVVKDVNNVNHTIIKVTVGDSTQFIVSKTEFVLNATINPITGFSRIKKGTTLINTPENGITTDDHYYWGTASNSLKLGGFGAEEFVRSTNALFPNGAKFYDVGYTLGDSDDLRVFVETGDNVVISNQLGAAGSQKLTMRIVTSGGDRDYIFGADAFYSFTDSARTLGAAGARWLNVFSTTFTGNLIGNSTGLHTGNVIGNVAGNVTGLLTGNVISTSGFTVVTAGSTPGSAVFVGTLNGTSTNSLALNSKTADVGAVVDTVAIRDLSGNLTANSFIGTATLADRLKIDNAASDTDPNYRSAKTTQTANTIVARDVNADITTRIFIGTATSAQYADLAEKYLADAEYEIGTVIAVGGEKEVTASSHGDRALGVVSENPAYMMNSELEGGTYIALKGRVPVKVMGVVRKGQRLIAANGGYAVVAGSYANDVFAIALENNNDTGAKLVEAVVL